MRWRGDQRADQHAAAHAAAIAGPDAGQRHHGAGRHQGREAARARSGRDPPDQLARRARRSTARRSRTASAARHQRVREGGARSRRRAVQLGRAQGAQRVSGADRRCAASASPSVRTAPGSIGFDGLMTIRPDGKLYVQSGVGNLGTHSVHRPRARRRRRAGDAVGEGRSHLGQHRQSICRGPACRSAARRRTR